MLIGKTETDWKDINRLEKYKTIFQQFFKKKKKNQFENKFYSVALRGFHIFS